MSGPRQAHSVPAGRESRYSVVVLEESIRIYHSEDSGDSSSEVLEGVKRNCARPLSSRFMSMSVQP